mgnify:CR=1 FL=1
MTDRELYEMALEVSQNAYAPYSNYFVGAVLVCDDGTLFTGFNIENASFSPTICAERTAFFKAIYDGHRDFTAIAVCGGKNGVITAKKAGKATITVRSAETGDIKYKVWMGADPSQRAYYCLLSSGWGRNATFAFAHLDEFFSRIRGAEHKLRVAQLRLEYPVELSDEAKKKYEAYVKKNAPKGE